MKAAVCRHCKQRVAKRGARGLCKVCYNTPGLRDLYPPLQVARPPGQEPSAAELDRMIAEQRAALPPWWDAETRKLTGGQE